MTALTQDRDTPSRSGKNFNFPVAASVVCFAGGIAVLDASGNVKPGVVDTGLVAVGRFNEYVDNASGTAAAVNANVEPGVFRFNNSASTDQITKSDIGGDCYVVDDQTVAKTNGGSTRSAAGKVVDIDNHGVWVKIGI